MTKFQLILTAVFGLFIVVGVIVFSTYRGGSANVAEVVIWGTMPESYFNTVVQTIELNKNKAFSITYVEKSEENFDTEFLEALASGQGPDLFMLPSEKILTHRNKVFPIPYDVYTQRQFKDSFIEGAEIYMAPEGILGLPLSVNPLVMYWNRDIFTNARLTEPPKYWDEFYNLANLISKKDGSLNIQESAVAFGEFANIKNAKEIISNLAMQAGTPITVWNGQKPASVFAESFSKPTIPAEAAVNFYTEFANPAKTSYSWNRSLPNSTDYFLSNSLALYFGFGDEIRQMQIKNPNLNFDVAPVPVSREGGMNVSYAKFQSFAIAKSSSDPNAAFSVASILTGADASLAFSQVLRLPPSRRDLLSKKPISSYESVFYDMAIRGRGWLDPNPKETNLVFKNMIESITSGRGRTAESVSRANRELSNLLAK